MPAHPTPTTVDGITLDTAFGEAFAELVDAWEHHHELRRSDDFAARMTSRQHLDRARHQIAQHRRRLAA